MGSDGGGVGEDVVGAVDVRSHEVEPAVGAGGVAEEELPLADTGADGVEDLFRVHGVPTTSIPTQSHGGQVFADCQRSTSTFASRPCISSVCSKSR